MGKRSLSMIHGTRQGWFSERTRDEAFKEIVSEGSKKDTQCRLILQQIINNGSQTMAEISYSTGIPVHIVSARLNELRNEYDAIYTDGEKLGNVLTRKMNILWKLKTGFVQVSLFPERTAV